MPRLTLSAAERTQLNEWLSGGPTEPVGLLNSAPDAQSQGERDLYQKLLAQDGKNVTRSTFSSPMYASLEWVYNSLLRDESAGVPIPEHQQGMRTRWDWLRSL